jgi:hypothetical protein
MGKCTCRRGEQGPVGPAGTANFSVVRFTNTSVPSQTDLVLIASAPQTGNILLFGQLAFTSNGAVNYQTSILVNGTGVVAASSRATGAAPVALSSQVTLPISDIIAVGAGDVIEIRINLQDYTKSTDVEGNIQYAYQ